MRIDIWRLLAIAACLSALPGCLGNILPEEPETPTVRDFDFRAELEPQRYRPTPEQAAAEGRLSAAVPGGPRVTYNPRTGVLHNLSGRTAALSEPASGTPEAVARQFVRDHLDLFGLVAADFADMRLRDQVPGAVGASHLVWQQYYDGLGVYNGLLQVSVAADGRVTGLSNSFAPLTNASPDARPRLTAAEAVHNAILHLRQTTATPPGALDISHGTEQTTPIDPAGISRRPIVARLMWLPESRHDVRLVWHFVIHTPDGEHVYEFTVDARSGRVLTRFDRVFETDYRVYPAPVESPNHAVPAGMRSLVTDPHDSTASPFGWHDTDGVPGAEHTVLRGNNTFVYTDHFDRDSPPATLADCGAALDCDFPLDLGRHPVNFADAVATNVFYWTNLFHDVMHRHGFGPAAGAFQINNYGAGGVAGDTVLAEVQNGWGTGTELLCTDFIGTPVRCRNNATFTTAPDGEAGRLELQLWDRTSPERDAGLDAGIIVHELGHGLSGRLVGGPSTVSCLAGEARGISEGISDYLALTFTQQMTHNAATPRGIATYPAGEPVTGPGLRGEPYSLNPAVNGAHFERVRQCLPVTSVPYPHCAGEIWTQFLWGVHWDLIGAHGYWPDLADAGRGRGNQRMLSYLVESLKRTRCEPDFLGARDGLLLATLITEDLCPVFRRAARFGLGSDAIPITSTYQGPANGHGVPTSCLGPLHETWQHNPEPSQGDDFGRAVVIRGDTAIIGAPFDEHEGVRSGAAFVFVRGPTGWVQQAKLTLPGGADGDRFGIAVDLQGDYAIVGAPGRDLPEVRGGGEDSGVAYVFRRVLTASGPHWEREGGPLKALSPGRDDRFGTSVAINTRRGGLAVVGAPNSEGTGAAFVYERQPDRFGGHEWVLQGSPFITRAVLRGRTSGRGALFGQAVDFASDGETILVGAPGDNTLAIGAGSAHVFERLSGDGTFRQAARFLPRRPGLNAAFGSALTLGVNLGESGDPPLAVVGAPGTGASQGAAYLYTRPVPGWADDLVPMLVRPLHWGTDPAGAVGDRFGTSLDISGDLLVVGAPGDEATTGRGRGSAFLFDRRSIGWVERNRIRRMADTRHSRIAAAISISAGVILVGADRDHLTDSGSVFFYE